MADFDPDCLFCKIVAGQVPAARVLETADAVAFLDIGPVNKGHILLVPKAHHSNLSELSDEAAASTARLLPRLARAVIAATGADGLNLVVNNGAAAGQTVGHGHWHLIPRFAGDAVDWPWPHQKYEGEELAVIRARIGASLGAP